MKRKPRKPPVEVKDADPLMDLHESQDDGSLTNDTLLPDMIGVAAPQMAILGETLRPVTMTTLGYLTRAKSELVSGKPASEIGDFMMEVVMFFLVQKGSLEQGLDQATMLGSMDEVSRRNYLYAYADKISPKDGVLLTAIATRMLDDAFSTQVEVIPNKVNDATSPLV